MAKKTIVRIDGVKVAKKALRQLGPRINGVVKEVVRESAEAVADGWARRIRRDTGRSAEGLGATYSGDGLTAEVGEQFADRKHVVAFLEHGTSSIPARPSGKPAAEDERPRLPKRLEKAIAAELEKRR